jgi:hypothetical protein
MDDIHRKSLIATIQRILDVDYKSDAEVHEMLQYLRKNVPSSRVRNIIFMDDDDSTAEMMLDKMLADRPIILNDLSDTAPDV